MARIESPFSDGSCASDVIKDRDLNGMTALVTGGAAGLGLETSIALAKGGADVVVAVRDLDHSREGLHAISEVGRENGKAMLLDLADLASVRAFALSWGNRPLHVLINNAGVMACPLSRTRDGLESQIGVNHFGHFLLSALLRNALEAGAMEAGKASRVVALSSGAHRFSDIHFDDMHYKRRNYDKWQAYGQSKTANILFAVEWTRRFAQRGIFANAVMPGRIRTSLSRHLSSEELAAAVKGPKGPHAYKTAQQGAATTVWAAVGPEMEGIGGLYLEDCAEAAFATPGAAGGVMAYAMDTAAAARLWSVSEAATGLTSAP